MSIRQILVLLTLLPAAVSAQQDPMYSMYMFDKLLINPAFAGSSNWAVGTLKYRDHATGLAGNPNTQTFNFHTPLQKQHMGVGVKVIKDRMALVNSLNAALALSYHLNFAGAKLSFGLEGSMMSRKISYQDLILNTRGDQNIPTTEVVARTPDAAFGLYYQKKQFYLGASCFNILQHYLYAPNSIMLQSPAHFNLLAGNVFQLKGDWTLEPSVLVKYRSVGEPQADVNLMVYYDDVIGAGIQYRSRDAVAAVFRLQIFQGLRLAYAFDKTISSVSAFSRNSHEVILSYGWQLLPPATKKTIHPRYYF